MMSFPIPSFPGVVHFADLIASSNSVRLKGPLMMLSLSSVKERLPSACVLVSKKVILWLLSLLTLVKLSTRKFAFSLSVVSLYLYL